MIVNVTPFEPEWEGYVTLEISNTTPLPAKIYANEGIAQVPLAEEVTLPLLVLWPTGAPSAAVRRVREGMSDPG